MGLAGLVGTPFRTALAALGIVIGVAAVVTLTSLGNGIQESVSGQITDLGPNLITITPGSDEGDPFGASAESTLTIADAERVAELRSVAAATSNVAAVGRIDDENVPLSGVDPSYKEIRSVSLAAGRFLNGRDEVVLSERDAMELLDASPREAVGQTITIAGASPGTSEATSQDAPDDAPSEDDMPDLPEGVSQEDVDNARNAVREQQEQQGEDTAAADAPAEDAPAEDAPAAEGKEYEVVGVAGAEEVGFGPPIAQNSYVSTRDALGLSGTENIGQIIASATTTESVSMAERGITSGIEEAHNGIRDFTVTTQEELLSTFTEITDQLNIFLAGIAGISLLVGGIGIMNIMLVSVTERTREIGVRKALGATDSDVLLQFLFEAVMLAALGGLAGIGLGIAASELLPRVLPDLPPAVFGVGQIALAFGVAALIGVVFGSLPAYRSARLAPVEALRRE